MIAFYDPNHSWCRQKVEITYQMWDFKLTVCVDLHGNLKGYSVLESAIFRHAQTLCEEHDKFFDLILTKKDEGSGEDHFLEVGLNTEDDDLEEQLQEMCVGLRIVEQVAERRSEPDVIGARVKGGAA